MKKVYIAFKIESDGSVVPHDHPVFTGDTAYDLQQEEEVQVCEKLNVREFTGVGQLISAVNDYNRDHAKSADVLSGKDGVIEVGDVYVIERITFDTPSTVAKSKKKIVAKSKSK